MGKPVAIATFLGAAALLWIGLAHAQSSADALEAHRLDELDADLRAALDDGADRLATMVRRSRDVGLDATAVDLTVARADAEGSSTEALEKAARLERADDQAALDAYLALILETEDGSEQVAAMRNAARILARRDARGPAAKLLEEALLVVGASQHERELASEALALYRGTPAPQREFRVPSGSGRPLRGAFARALAAPGADQVVAVDATRVAWRIPDEGTTLRLAVAQTDDVLHTVVPGYAEGRWERVDRGGFVAPPPFPRLRLAVDAKEIRTVAMEAKARWWTAASVAFVAVAGLLAAGLLVGVALRRQRRVEERKRAFTCAVTHELKTPIANIALYAETLREHGRDDPDNVPKFADVILAEAERLRRRVQEVLDVATGQSTLPARRDLFQPKAAIEEVCEEYRSRGATIEIDAEAASARGVPTLFRRAFEGIVDNAVKFAPDGRIRVGLHQRNGDLLLTVEDEGPGVPAAERQRVFEPYVRLVDEMTREVAGTGLGLTLVKQCVEDCGGTIEIGDGARGGCRVTVKLEGAGNG